MDNAKLIKLFRNCEQGRTTVQQIWDLIEEYFSPYRGRFFRDQRDEHSIEWRQRQVWDSSPISACQTLAANMQGNLTSASTQWFSIGFRNSRLNEDVAAKEWLHDCSEAVYNALQDSNFNVEISETYEDLCGFGTAFLVEEERDEEIDFKAIPLKEGYFEESADGGVGRFYRKFQFTPFQLIDRFGDDVPQQIKDKNEAGNDEKQDVLFVIFPRQRGAAKLGGKLAPSRRPYGFKYMLLDTAEDLGKEGGYYEMPVFGPRWRKTSESIWGNSPAMIAMNDALTLNAWVELATIADEKALDPPMAVEEYALLTDLDLDARALNVVRNIEGIKPIPIGKSQNITENGIVRLQQAIRTIFFNDQMLFPPPQGTPMTATEAQIRYELMQRLLGPTLGRLQTDLFDRIIARTFNILARSDRLPEFPASLQGEDVNMNIQYTGPLARAQKAEGALTAHRWVMQVGEAAQAAGPDEGQNMLDVIDGEEYARLTGLQLSVDPQMMRGKVETKERRDNREANMQQAASTQQAQEQGAAMEAMGKGEQEIAVAQQTAGG